MIAEWGIVRRSGAKANNGAMLDIFALATSLSRGKSMRLIITAVVAAAALAGCGVETATTAAAVAAAKKQEIEQGRKTMQQVQENVGKAMEQTQQRAQQAEDSAEK